MSSGVKEGGKSKVKKEDETIYDDDFVDTKPKIQQPPQDDFDEKPKPTAENTSSVKVIHNVLLLDFISFFLLIFNGVVFFHAEKEGEEGGDGGI